MGHTRLNNLTFRVTIDTTDGIIEESFELDTDGHHGYTSVNGVLQAVLEFTAEQFPESLRRAISSVALPPPELDADTLEASGG